MRKTDPSGKPIAPTDTPHAHSKNMDLWVGIAVFMSISACLAVIIAVPSLSRRGPHIDSYTLSSMRGLGQALLMYQQEHGASPPDLNALGAWDGSGRVFQTRRFVRAGLAGPGVYYLPEAVDPSAPDNWIVAYEAWVDADQKSLGILYASGVVRRLSMPEFRREIERFRRAFAAARGAPPRVVDAHTAMDLVSTPSETPRRP